MALCKGYQLTGKEPYHTDLHKTADENKETDKKENSLPFHVREIGQLIAIRRLFRGMPYQHECARPHQRDRCRLEVKRTMDAKRDVDQRKKPYTPSQQHGILNGIPRIQLHHRIGLMRSHLHRAEEQLETPQEHR